MATGVVNLRYFVLGLLAQQPMSGYDIKRVLKGLNWLVGIPSSGSLYPILRGLLQEALVRVEVIPGVDRPPRKIYRITEAGEQAVRGWIEQPVAADAPLKAFVMRLLLADLLPPEARASHLKQRRKQVASQYQALTALTADLEPDADLGQYLASHYGLTLAQAELNWLDNTLAQWSQPRPPEEDGQHSRTHSIP